MCKLSLLQFNTSLFQVLGIYIIVYTINKVKIIITHSTAWENKVVDVLRSTKYGRGRWAFDFTFSAFFPAGLPNFKFYRPKNWGEERNFLMIGLNTYVC